jgi:short-subunit dehydrogenase
MPAKTLLIVGSGPGIALKTALLFASQGFTNIALISRTQSNLDKTASSIAAQHARVNISTHACDLSNSQSLTSALAAVEKALCGTPEVILFNAANVSPAP